MHLTSETPVGPAFSLLLRNKPCSSCLLGLFPVVHSLTHSFSSSVELREPPPCWSPKLPESED